MSRRARRRAGHALVGCPVCGQQSRFTLYALTIRTHRLIQESARRWRHTVTEPRRLDPHLPFMLVCESCGYPVGQPPPEAVSAIPTRSRRRG